MVPVESDLPYAIASIVLVKLAGLVVLVLVLVLVVVVVVVVVWVGAGQD